MNLIDKISNEWISKIRKAGAGALLVVILLLFLDYYNSIKLSSIPIPNLSIYLWGYLILNAGGASFIHYFLKEQNGKNYTQNKNLKVKKKKQRKNKNAKIQ